MHHTLRHQRASIIHLTETKRKNLERRKQKPKKWQGWRPLVPGVPLLHTPLSLAASSLPPQSPRPRTRISTCFVRSPPSRQHQVHGGSGCLAKARRMTGAGWVFQR
jgi:hypothetical protein